MPTRSESTEYAVAKSKEKSAEKDYDDAAGSYSEKLPPASEVGQKVKEVASKSGGRELISKYADAIRARERSSKETGYEYSKGGMVSKKGGGSVRGAGVAQRGQGKMRVF